MPSYLLAFLILSPALLAQSSKKFLPGEVPDSWLDPAAPEAKTAPSKKAKASERALFEKLCMNPRVTLLRVSRCLHQPSKGAASEIVNTKDAWIAVRRGRVAGLFDAALLPEDADKPMAKILDLRKVAPKAFAMPGLFDADSRLFRAASDFSDSKAKLESDGKITLQTWQKTWRDVLAQGGVTDVYVPLSLRAFATGPGACVSLDPARGPRPSNRGGAYSFRLSTPGSRSNSLSRASVTKGLESAIESAKKYAEGKKKFEKALAEYKKKRSEFLAFYKKNPLKPGQKAPESKPSRPARGASRGGRVGIRMTREMMERLRKMPPAERRKFIAKLRSQANGQPKPKAATPPKGTKKPTTSKGSSKKAPPRPKYPKKYKVDPSKEAMLAVLDKKSPLRIEVHRKAELRALFALIKKHKLTNVTVVGATEAWQIPSEVRDAGVTVLLRPESLPSRGLATLPEQVPQSASILSKAGVPVAIGSAGASAGQHLLLQVARAVGFGMPTARALESVTRTARHSAGAARSNKLAVFDKDPLAPDARLICVIDSRKTYRFDAAQKR